jgi:hypothetical protein
MLKYGLLLSWTPSMYIYVCVCIQIDIIYIHIFIYLFTYLFIYRKLHNIKPGPPVLNIIMCICYEVWYITNNIDESKG